MNDDPQGQPPTTQFPYQTLPETPPVIPPQPKSPLSSIPEQPKKSRKKLFIILSIIGIVLIVAVIASILFIRSSQQNAISELSKNLPYDYTTPIKDVSSDYRLNYKLSYDPDTLASYTKNKNYNDAIAVFTDSSLTHHAWASIIPQKSPFTGKVTNFLVKPRAGELVAKNVFDGKGATFGLNPAETWGPNNEYYIVRYLNEKGDKLKKPIVTKMTVKKELDTPIANTSISSDGVLSLKWNPVDKATNYFITKFVYEKQADGSFELSGDAQLVGQTSATTWNSGEEEVKADNAEEGIQNPAFKTFEKSEDELHGDTLSYVDNNKYSVEYGVIATTDPNKTDSYKTSSYAPIQGDDINRQLPYTMASNAADEVLNSTADNVDGIPEQMPMTMADGSTTLRAVIIDPSRTKIDHGKLYAYFSVAGTNIKYYITVNSFNSTTYKSDVAAVADRNIKAQQRSGAAVAYQYIQPRKTVENASKTRPSVPYQVNSTDNFSDYLAANMIAGNELIDISKYIDASSLSLSDVIYQVKYQNPYILGFEGYSYHEKEKVLEVKYSYTAQERADYQKKLADTAQNVLSQIITPSMSEKQKALAINNYLVKTGQYNYDALAIINDTSKVNSTEFRDNWSAIGILLNKTGVCQSYSDAFKLLADAAGIKAVTVTGMTDSGRHAWNKVFMDGKWQNVDVTWDDNGANATELFGLTDATIKAQFNHAEDKWYAIDSLLPTYAAV